MNHPTQTEDFTWKVLISGTEYKSLKDIQQKYFQLTGKSGKVSVAAGGGIEAAEESVAINRDDDLAKRVIQLLDERRADGAPVTVPPPPSLHASSVINASSTVPLHPAELSLGRDLIASQVAKRWRKRAGDLVDALLLHKDRISWDLQGIVSFGGDAAVPGCSIFLLVKATFVKLAKRVPGLAQFAGLLKSLNLLDKFARNSELKTLANLKQPEDLVLPIGSHPVAHPPDLKLPKAWYFLEDFP